MGRCTRLRVVRFVSREIIVAPTIVHNISFAGDSNRAAIHRTDADLYFVYRPHCKNWWITADTTVSYDFKADVKSATEKVSFGTRLAKIGKAAVNVSVQPGVGIGGDRPFNWSLQTGIALVGF